MARPFTWAVALATLALLAALAQLSLREANRPMTLGIATELRNGAVLVTYALPAGLGWDCGLRPGERLLTADGRPASEMSVSALNGARMLTFQKASGQVVTMDCTPVSLPDNAPKRAAFLFIAAAFALLGAVVVALIDELALGRLFFLWAAVTAISLEAAVAQVSGRAWSYVVETLGVVAFGVCTLVLFARFPVDWLDNKRISIPVVALGTWHAALASGYLYAVSGQPQAYELVQRALYLSLVLDICVALISVSYPVCGAVLRRHKPPAANVVLLTGAVSGLAPFLLLTLVPQPLGVGSLVPADTAILSLILLPLSLAATMGRLFTIHSWLRRGLIRLFVWTLLLITYGLLLTAVEGQVARGGTILQFASSPFIVVVAVGATLPLLERKLRTKLESALLQDVYSFPAALQQFASRIVHLRTAEDIANYALASLGATLDLRWAALQLSSAQACTFEWGACPANPAEQAAEVAPLSADGSALGTLLAGPKRHDIELLPQDRVMIHTIAPLLAISLQLAWQIDIVAQHESELESLNQQLLDVQEEVRRRIALELHDDAMQRAILLAREFEDRAENAARHPDWRESVVELVIALRSVCVGLYPTVLDDLGLPAGLEQLVSELRAKTDVSADLLVAGSNGDDFGRLDRELELALYRIAQESLNNVRKHSSARHVLVSLRRVEGAVELTVSDDGAIQPARGPALPSQPDIVPGLGVAGMRHRLARWNGSLSIADHEGGVQVHARAPLEAAAT